MAYGRPDLIELERYMGKRIYRMHPNPMRYGYDIQFEDGSMMYVDEGMVRDLEHRARRMDAERQYRQMMTMQQMQQMQYPLKIMQVDPETLRVDPEPEYACRTYKGQMYGMRVYEEAAKTCKSCGGFCSSKKLDHHGFCKKKADAFWAKVRRLYWHRHGQLQELAT